MPNSEIDISQRLGRLEALVAALAPAGPALNTVAQSDDVKFGTLADGDVPTWTAATHAFTNQPSGGSASFPLTSNDGTYTRSLSVTSGGGGGLFIKNLTNSGSVLESQIELYNGGGLEFRDFTGNGTFFFDNNGGGTFFNDLNGGGIFFNLDNAGGFAVNDNDGGGILFRDFAGGGITLRDDASGGLFFLGLPTSAPGGSKQVWNNGGVLNITA